MQQAWHGWQALLRPPSPTLLVGLAVAQALIMASASRRASSRKQQHSRGNDGPEGAPSDRRAGRGRASYGFMHFVYTYYKIRLYLCNLLSG